MNEGIERKNNLFEYILLVVLSFLFPGIGQIYVGRLWKGTLFIVLMSISYFVTLSTYGFFPLVLIIWIIANADNIISLYKSRRDNAQIIGAKYKRTLIAFFIYSGLIVVSILAYYGNLVGLDSLFGMSYDKKQVEEYLYQKYGEEFTAKKVSYDVPSIGAKKIIKTTVLYKKDPNISFEVSRLENSFEYHENFIDVLWSKEVNGQIESYIRSKYLIDPIIQVKLFVSEAIKKRMNGRLVDFKEAKENYQDLFNSEHLSADISIIKFKGIDHTSELSESDNVLNTISFIKGNCVSSFNLLTYYFDEDFEKEGMEIIKHISIEDFLQIEGGTKIHHIYKKHNKLRAKLILNKEKLNLINKPDDIPKYFKYVRK